MKKLFEQFDWGRFVQFSIPYAFGMKIFSIQESWVAAIISGTFFGLFMSIFMGNKVHPEEIESRDLPETFEISHHPLAKLTYFSLFGLSLFSTFTLGTISLFIFQIAPNTPKDYPHLLYSGLFFTLSFGLYFALRNIQYKYIVNQEGVSKSEKTLFGSIESSFLFENVRRVETNHWGVVFIHLKDDSVFKIVIPLGKDFSFYKGMNIPVEDIKNFNTPGAYQLASFIGQYSQKKKLEALAA